ncbi:MAG: T9SS type A sorting domain-containing protein, partial [Bacteroidales bacterium]
EISESPDGLLLRQNFPNPVSSGTTISWRLPETGHVVLKIIDYTGSEVKTLIDYILEKGEHTLYFYVSGLTSGIYFYQLQADGKTRTQKMIVRQE